MLVNCCSTLLVNSNLSTHILRTLAGRSARCSCNLTYRGSVTAALPRAYTHVCLQACLHLSSTQHMHIRYTKRCARKHQHCPNSSNSPLGGCSRSSEGSGEEQKQTRVGQVKGRSVGTESCFLCCNVLLPTPFRTINLVLVKVSRVVHWSGGACAFGPFVLG